MEVKLDDIIPNALYKYRDFQHKFHRRIITHQEIYFAKPSDFLASYDCTYKIDRDYIKNEENRRVYYAKSCNLVDLHHPTIDYLIQNNPITDELIDKLELSNQEMLDNITGVFSGSLTNRNLNLWKEFGGNNKGFCIELNLLDTFPLNFGSKGYVKYVKENELPKSKVLNHDNLIEFISYTTDLIFNLPLEYSDEQEYRIEKLFFKEENRKFQIQKHRIKSITLGYKMSESNRNEIIELIKTHLPKTIIKRLKYSRSNLKEVIIE